MVRKKARYPLMPFFSVASPGYSIPLLCHNNPHCFFVFVCCLSGKIPSEKPYQPCGYGENASMFLAMFLHSGKIMLCGKGSAQD